jgi:hypothetical protein
MNEASVADDDLHQVPSPDVAGYLLGTLEAGERVRFAAHLAGCGVCRAEVAELRGVAELVGQLRDLPLEVTLPEGLKARVTAAVEQTAAEALPAPAGESAPGAERPSALAPARPRRRSRVWLAVAAAVVVVAISAALVGVLRSRSTGSVALATIRLVAVDGGRARATAVVRKNAAGITIDMTVRSLPPPPAGTFYACWLVGPGDTLAHPDRVSVGSFVTPPSGDAEVHWTTAADRGRFPSLGVTVEPDNGNPSHQGPKVLATA